MLSPRWQPFQKMLSVAVITSVVVGGDAGVIVFGVSRLLYLAIAVYYAVKAVILLAAGTVAMRTDKGKRRKACLKIMRIVSPGWPWPSRSSGSQP